jgi:hypothetical protein
MKRDDKRPRSGRRKNLLKAISVLAVGAGASLAHLPAAQAYQVAISSGDEATLEQFLRDHPTSLYAPDIIGRLSFGMPKADTAIEPVVLAKNNGNGGGHGGGNGGGNGNGKGGGNSGGGGSSGGSDSDSGGSDAGDSDGGDSDGGESGQSNGGNGRFKDEDDTGRPDMFGDPGVPDIGPPGQSGY